MRPTRKESISLYSVAPPSFLWDEALRTGNATIDQQHESLREALMGISRLLELPDVNVKYWLGLVSRTIDEYVLTHFITEEQLMATEQYPDLPTHKLRHMAFLAAFKAHQAQFARLQNDAEQMAAAKALLAFLNDWFTEEVLSSDKELALFIQNKP
ncbi:MAG: hypothetical protein HQL88_06050 [Magnetococcales bacterium]|nr:hypothetical protein [Magnetococcales bacterium]